MYDKCYFCLDQLPKLKRESTASFFRKFWEEPGYKRTDLHYCNDDYDNDGSDNCDYNFGTLMILERKRFFFWDVFPNCSITELKKRAKRSITANSLHLLICFLVSLYLSKYK